VYVCVCVIHAILKKNILFSCFKKFIFVIEKEWVFCELGTKFVYAAFYTYKFSYLSIKTFDLLNETKQDFHKTNFRSF